jgi:hypothetical protein
MNAVVSVNTLTHTITYVTAKMLLSLKEIIREIGLNPSTLTKDWNTYENGIATWLGSRHLQQVTLEVYDPETNELVARWDLDVVYGSTGDGTLWVDIETIKYAIAKAGLSPARCQYNVILHHRPNPPHVPGWQNCEYRSTDGFRRYAIGATIGGNGIGAETAYWRK